MIIENLSKNNPPPRILVSPLDWGLGHATRLIPLISKLLEKGATVIIAASGATESLLKQEFPTLQFLPLPGYGISYSAGKKGFLLNLIRQTPKMLLAIRNERHWVKKWVAELQIDAVISDNRFGFYSAKLPSIMITHQLFIETGNGFLNKLAQRINYSYINHFTECWVPDAAGRCNLAGALSHPEQLPSIPVKYLGIISRFKQEKIAEQHNLLIILSGPEPQRSIWEKELMVQLEQVTIPVTLLRGLPGSTQKISSGNQLVTIHNHLPAHEMNEVLQAASLVISRCGYTTVMDLAIAQKKAILVPTPGQTEQEWLAKYLSIQGIFYSVEQENFQLETAIREAAQFKFKTMEAKAGMNETLLDEFLSKL